MKTLGAKSWAVPQESIRPVCSFWHYAEVHVWYHRHVQRPRRVDRTEPERWRNRSRSLEIATNV
jgi:hypothetical protein